MDKNLEETKKDLEKVLNIIRKYNGYVNEITSPFIKEIKIERWHFEKLATFQLEAEQLLRDLEK